MSWIVQKLEEYKRYYAPISISGIVSYPITLYNFINQTDDALRENFNRTCGTNYSRDDKWNALKKETIGGQGSSTGFLRGVRSRAHNVKAALKTLGWKPHLWYFAQEASYMSAILPLQIEAGLYLDSDGGSILSSVGANALAGSAISWSRRAVLFWYADKSVRALLRPTPEVCAFAKNFEKAPVPLSAVRRFGRNLLEGANKFFANIPSPTPETVGSATTITGAAIFLAALKSLVSFAVSPMTVFIPPGVIEGIEERDSTVNYL